MAQYKGSQILSSCELLDLVESSRDNAMLILYTGGLRYRTVYSFFHGIDEFERTSILQLLIPFRRKNLLNGDKKHVSDLKCQR